jgi:hypothetical protein
MKATKKAEALQEQAMEKLLPILQKQKLRGVGMSANNFETIGQPPGVSSIQNFFSSSGAEATKGDAGTVSSSHRFSNHQPQQSMIRSGGVEQYFSSKSDTPTAEPSSSAEAKQGQSPSSNDNDPRAITPDASSIEKSDEELAKELQVSVSKDDSGDRGGSNNSLVSNKEPAIDNDVELARQLQAKYDRENYVLTATSRRSAVGGPPKKKARSITTFFQPR